MSRTWMALFVLALASLSPSPSLWAQGRHFRSELYPTDMCPLSGYELHDCDQSMCLLACRPSGPARQASHDVYCLSDYDPAYDELIYGDEGPGAWRPAGRRTAGPDSPDRCTDYEDPSGAAGLADSPRASIADSIASEPKYWDGYGDYVQGFYPLDYYYDDRAEQADLDAACPSQTADCYRWFDDSRYIHGYGGDRDRYEGPYNGQYQYGQYGDGYDSDGYDSGCYDQGHDDPGYGASYSRGDRNVEQGDYDDNYDGYHDDNYDDYDDDSYSGYDDDGYDDGGYDDDGYDDGGYDDGGYDDGGYDDGGYDDGGYDDGGYDEGYDDLGCGYDEFGQPYDNSGWTDDADLRREPAEPKLNKRRSAERKQWQRDSQRDSQRNDDEHYYGDSWDSYDSCGDSPFDGPATPPESADYWEEYADYGDLYPTPADETTSAPVVDDWDDYSACDVGRWRPRLTSGGADPLLVRWVQQAVGAWNWGGFLTSELLTGRGVKIQDAVIKVAAWWQGHAERAAWNCHRPGRDQWSR